MWELITLLIVSIFFNIVAFWYVRTALEKLLFISDHLDFMDTSLKAFKANLDAVYETEKFYGDETLEALCHHAKEVSSDIDIFSAVVEVFTAIELEEEELPEPEEELESTSNE
jgi:hypothetical protein